MEKKTLRKKYRMRRNQMSTEEVRQASLRICDRILESDLFAQAEFLYAYYPLGNEVDVRPVVERAWKRGKKVAFPRVFGEEMRFFAVNSFDELSPGYFGVMEPEIGDEVKWATQPESQACAVREDDAPNRGSKEDAVPDRDMMDTLRVNEAQGKGREQHRENGQCGQCLVLVPGVAFDVYGNRMGYGKGYYDRYFSGEFSGARIGVCYDLQMAEYLPTDQYDVPLPYLVTESGLQVVKQREID